MEEGSQTDANALMTWSGADITLTTDPTNRALTAKGNIAPTSIESYGITTNIGTVSFDVEQDRSQYSFGIGTAHIDVASLTVTSPAQPKAGFSKVSIDVSSELDDDRVNSVASIEFGHVIMPALGDMNLYLDVAAKGLDANSMEVFVSELRAAQAQQPNAPMEALLPQVEDDLEALLAQGVEIDITRLDVSLPQGDLSTTININIPESATGSAFSWPGIILATTASVDLRISTSLYELAESMNPDANMLLAMGILKHTGENYEMEVRYASGLLTINGAPMTVPLGLPQ